MAFNGTTAEDICMAATGWRKRQIYDSQVHRMQDQEGNVQEPNGTHEGHWPQEAMPMLRLSSPASTWIPLLRSKSAVDVLLGHEGRREDGPTGPGSRESLDGDRSREESTK